MMVGPTFLHINTLRAFDSTKIPFEISRNPRAKWNGSLRLHRPTTSHHAFGYHACKQDTDERY